MCSRIFPIVRSAIDSQGFLSAVSFWVSLEFTSERRRTYWGRVRAGDVVQSSVLQVAGLLALLLAQARRPFLPALALWSYK